MQIRPCYLHSTNQGITRHLLRSTTFAIIRWVRGHTRDVEEDLDCEREALRLIKLIEQQWTANMQHLRNIRDVTGVCFSKHLCKLPESLFKEVLCNGKAMSKLKAFEYKEISLVSFLTGGITSMNIYLQRACNVYTIS